MGEAIGLSGHPAPRHTWSSWVAQFVRSPLSVRAHVVGLILVVLAPLLLLTSALGSVELTGAETYAVHDSELSAGAILICSSFSSGLSALFI